MLTVIAACLAVYVLAVLALVLVGRRSHARALAGFVPDCVVLFRRLLGSPEVPRASKVLVGMALGYLLLPIDLVPDVIPVAGQLDDAIVVALVLRRALRAASPDLLARLWPGPAESLVVVRRLAGA